MKTLSYHIPQGNWPLKPEMYENFFKSLGFFSKKNADFLVLPGGADIGIQQERDISETEAYKNYLSSKRKVVAICRGMQLCLANSGSFMIPHLPALTRLIKHTTISEKLQGASSWHTTNLGFVTNTRHHQGFLEVGDDWKILDSTPDGVVESVKNNSVFGVQWHPEMPEMKNTRALEWYVSVLKEHLNS